MGRMIWRSDIIHIFCHLQKRLVYFCAIISISAVTFQAPASAEYKYLATKRQKASARVALSQSPVSPSVSS